MAQRRRFATPSIQTAVITDYPAQESKGAVLRQRESLRAVKVIAGGLPHPNARKRKALTETARAFRLLPI
ncbi:hypothetical protein HA42_15155 [Pantoea deleyi]|nr:hypothetical protein HA42_15155 [Pantoea deleyi]